MRDNLMVALVFIGVFLVTFMIVFTPIIVISKVSCDNKWSDYEHKWDLFGGCMIMQDGSWISQDNLRIVLK